MNERQFLRKINRKNNRDGIFTYAAVYELLKDNKGISTYKKENIFKRVFSFNRNIKSATQIIDDNFENILKNLNNQHIGPLLTLLIEDKETIHIVNKQMDCILNNFKKNQSINRDEQSLLGFQQAEFLRALRDNPQGKQIIEENFESILESIPECELFENTQIIKGISEKTDNILNQYLQDNHTKVAKSLLQIYKIKYEDNQEQLLDDYTDTMSIMIKELLESEKASWIDVKN